jgi:hypothetical protein
MYRSEKLMPETVHPEFDALEVFRCFSQGHKLMRIGRNEEVLSKRLQLLKVGGFDAAVSWA